MRISPIRIAFTNSTVAAMNIQFGTLVCRNPSRGGHSLCLRTMYARGFRSPSLFHAPPSVARNDMLPFF
jgi:hypothetical protein